MVQLTKSTHISIVLIFFLPALIFAQVFKMTTKDLTKESMAIVVGKCVAKESYWNKKHDKIFTRIKFAVEQTIKGNSVAETEVLIPGGRVGNIIYEVSDMPVFTPGEESLVFLWKHKTGVNLVTGALHGKRDLFKDKVSGKKALRSEKDHKESVNDSKAKPQLLDDFVKEIKGYMKE
jgi:hypothetical protein